MTTYTLSCMDCGVLVVLGEGTRDVIMLGQGWLHAQRLPQLAEHEMVRCADCYAQWREKRGRQMVAEREEALDLLRDVREALAVGKEVERAISPERMRAVLQGDWGPETSSTIAALKLAEKSRRWRPRKGERQESLL